jgi:hypothetical protein
LAVDFIKLIGALQFFARKSAKFIDQKLLKKNWKFGNRLKANKNITI